MLLTDSNGNIQSIPASPFDAGAASQAYLQAVSALKLATDNAQTDIANQVQAALAAQQAQVAQMYADLQTALALDTSISATVQPQIDSAAAQFPDVVASFAPAQPAEKLPA